MSNPLSNNPLTLLPTKTRKVVYAVYGIVALVVACIDVGFQSAATDPAWLTITQDVLAYLAVPVGVLAASNTPASSAEIAEAVEGGTTQPPV